MSATETRHIGAALKRKEDDPLLRGRGTYVDNIDLPGHRRRWPSSAARTRTRGSRSIDTAAARAAEGVVAVFTGADLRDDWKAAMPCAWPVTEDMKSPEHFPLAVDEVHYQGDGVAVVIADTRAHAVDAAELVEVDYEPLDAIVDVEAAAQDGATLVHEELGTNVSYVWKLETGAFDDGADVIVKHRYVQPPLIPNAIEPRGVVARPEPGGDVTLWSATQIPHILRAAHRRDARHVRDEAARDRSRRRRRLRLEARRLRRGAARGRARATARHAGEVGRGALGERARDDPRP